MAIYDLGTASLAANGEVTGVGTTWKAPLTLIRVGATIVFKTEPVKIYTISEIISDTQINVYNPNSETVPAGTGYAILAHDGITVQGLAQDVAETLRYYQSRETEVSDAVDAFNNFDANDFETKVSQVNSQHGDVVTIASQVSSDASQVSADKDSAYASSVSAQNSANIAESAANSVSGSLVGNFDDGVTLQSKNQVIIQFIDGYANQFLWSGSFPKVVPAGSTPESTGGVGLGAWLSVGDASLRSDMDKPTGAGLSGFDKSVDYADDTVGGTLKNVIFVNPDMYATLQDAIDYAASLTGLEHSPSTAAGHPDWIQPNTVCKVVRLNGKKYPINTTLHIHGDVSIDAGFGGVYLTDDFIADSSGYAVKCDKGTGNQYAGHISNLLIDARAKTVNGFKISDGYANKLDGIYVANIDGHGIHIAGGMGVHLLKFYAVGVLKQTNPLSTAHIIEGSDHQVSMGEGRYFRFGTWVRDGGNNRIDKVHNWGMYDDSVADQNSRMKCCFVVQNSINNSFNQCFADSPSKWDYTKANLDAVDGYINGGIGFFIDGGATGNTFSQCQTFVNTNAFNDAGLSSYTASLMPFAVGSINCSFIECENSNSPAWVARLINHIYSISQSFTNILAAKNFVGIEYDTISNSTIFKRAVKAPVLVRDAKFETPTASYAPDFSGASYISATVTGDVTITPAVLKNTLTGYVEVLLSVYSTTSKTITFGENVKLASNTPSLTASGTQVFRLSTTDGGALWFCKFESAYP